MSGIIMPIMGQLAQQGGVVAVAPSSIPNLSLWYDPDVNTATKVTVNGSNEVTEINDLSGAGHPANSFGAKYPDYATNVLNGLGGVQYTSANSDNLDINPIAWAQSQAGFTMFAVVRPTTIGAGAFPLVVTNTGLGVQWTGTTWQIGGAGGVATPTSAITNNTATAHIYAIIFSGAATGDANRLRFRYDRQDIPLTFTSSPGTATSASASSMYFCGNNRNNPKNFMDGYLFEVMIWLRALTAAEIVGTEAYIRQHWNI